MNSGVNYRGAIIAARELSIVENTDVEGCPTRRFGDSSDLGRDPRPHRMVIRDSEVTIRSWACLVACLALSCTIVPAQVDVARALPIWTADLDAFSYASRPDPHNIGGKPYIEGKFADIGVAFKASDEVICYFVTHAGNVQLQRRERLEDSASFNLQIVAFDAKTGSLRFRKELPARPHFTSVAVNNDRNLLVRSGDTLRLYSSDFEVMKERLLEAKALDRWIFKVSRSGSTMLLEHYSPSDTYDEILNTTSFESLFAFKVQWFPVSSVTDKVLLKAVPDRNQILTRNFDGPWQEIPIPKLISCVFNPVLVNDAEVLNACGQQVTLISRSGQILMQDTLDRKEHLEQLVSLTPDGRLAAVSARQNKGGFMDLTSIKRSHTRILIYDTKLRRHVFSVPVEPIPQHDYDFGLAPDGNTLVIMIDSVVKAFAISPQKNPQENAR